MSNYPQGRYAKKNPPVEAPSFKTARHEFDLIQKIVDRSMGLSTARRYDQWTRMDMHMDLSAVHANGNPLRLDDLLAADDFNFAHDILGIRRNLDRETGKLENFFSPRFSARVTA